MSGNKLLEFCLATAASYKEAASNASRSLKKNWIILPASAGACLVFALAQIFFSRFGFTAGLFIGLIEILLISVYYCWLFDSIRRDKISFDNIIHIDGSVFSSVINTAFILFIIKFFIFSLVQGLSLEWVPILVQFGLVIVCNALPEVVYMHRFDGLSALSEAAKFTRDNWIEWFIPFIIILIPWLIISPPQIFVLMIGSDPFFPDLTELMPASVLFRSFEILPVLSGSFLGASVPYLTTIVSLAFGIIGFNWFMLFRGFLFKDFESGTRRQRMYRAKL